MLPPRQRTPGLRDALQVLHGFPGLGGVPQEVRVLRARRELRRVQGGVQEVWPGLGNPAKSLFHQGPQFGLPRKGWLRERGGR